MYFVPYQSTSWMMTAGINLMAWIFHILSPENIYQGWGAPVKSHQLPEQPSNQAWDFPPRDVSEQIQHFSFSLLGLYCSAMKESMGNSSWLQDPGHIWTHRVCDRRCKYREDQSLIRSSQGQPPAWPRMRGRSNLLAYIWFWLGQSYFYS